MSKSKNLLLPDAENDDFFLGADSMLVDEEAEEERDPYDRPDLLPMEPEEEETDFLSFDPFGGEYEPCPCCGADIPAQPMWGFICPVCFWEMDDDVANDRYAPSDQNHGLSLDEAQQNFRVFGICDPSLRWEK